MLGFDRILYLYDFIRPFLDIAVMTFILYKAYDFISKTNGVQMLKSLLIVVIVYGLAVLLKLQTILWLMNIIAPAVFAGRQSRGDSKEYCRPALLFREGEFP